ncbi:MAG: hypothetical protein AB7H97_20385 [Pseudobdellovibrionaceae bacterium]
MRIGNRSILSVLVLSILSLSVLAQAQRPGDSFRRDDRDGRGGFDRNRDHRDDRGDERRDRDNFRPSETKTGYVGRWVSSEVLPLMRILSIGPQDYGKRIESLIIEVRQVNRPGSVDLLIDGRVEDSDPRPYQNTTLYPRRPIRIGDFNTFQLGVRGHMYIDRVTVVLRNGGGGHNPIQERLTRQINRNYSGQSRQNLDSIVNLHAYRGMRVAAVEIRASTMAGQGMASVLINNRFETARQRVERQISNYTFFPAAGANIVGRDIMNLDLLMQGNFYLESITVILER